MDYYVYKDDLNIGPVGESEVQNGLRSGRFLPKDLGCRVGETSWKDLDFLFPLERMIPSAPVLPRREHVVSLVPRANQMYPGTPVHHPVVIYEPPRPIGASSDIRRLMYFEANKKSTGTAYLLWIFLGGLGAHRFYLGRPGSAIAQIAIFWLSFPLMWVLIGFLTVWITPIWLLVDLALIPQIAREHNNNLIAQTNLFH
jgi:TM2 domain-containing membrane protein YozV